MGESLVIIQQGDPAVAEAAFTFADPGVADDPTACRRMVFPNALFPPIVYSIAGKCFNPHVTVNFANGQPLRHHYVRRVLTQSSTRIVANAQNLADVIVTEKWPANAGASMTTALAMLFYNYYLNRPAYTIGQSEWITWEPRDQTADIYNVELVEMKVGGESVENRFNIADVLYPGADGGSNTIRGGTDGLNTMPTGLVTVDVEISFKLVSLVP